MNQRLRFASKVDGWLAAVILAAVLLDAVAIASVVQRAGTAQAMVMVPLIGIVGVGLPLWVLLRTDYELTGEELLVRSGPFRWRVPLRDIRAIEPSRSWLSGPALALDRLRIDHGCGRSVLVSPKERGRFLEALSRSAALSRAAAP